MVLTLRSAGHDEKEFKCYGHITILTPSRSSKEEFNLILIFNLLVSLGV